MNSFFACTKGDTIRRLEPKATRTNTVGYKRLNTLADPSALENRIGATQLSDDPERKSESVEQLYKILFDYAGVEVTVTSAIEPLFNKLGQTLLASGQIKSFDVRILPNEPQKSALHQSSSVVVVNPSVLCVTDLNIQSVCRQTLEHDQLHSANVQVGIRIQRVQQEVNLSLLRVVYQFYTVVDNGLNSTDSHAASKNDSSLREPSDGTLPPRSRTATLPNATVQSVVLQPIVPDPSSPEKAYWQRLRQLVRSSTEPIESKPLASSTTAKRRQQNDPAKSVNEQIETPSTEVANVDDQLLLSSFGWLIIDELYYAASLGGLQVDGCMKSVQGSVTLSQRLRAAHPNTKKVRSALLASNTTDSISRSGTMVR